MASLDTYEQKLLKAWEDIYKKGQLTFWILLAVKDGPKHMADIKVFIAETTQHTITADDQSMYRSLRRYETADMLTHTTAPGQGGPERKVYTLTPAGERILDKFCERNIAIFYQSSIQKLVNPQEVSEHEV